MTLAATTAAAMTFIAMGLAALCFERPIWVDPLIFPLQRRFEQGTDTQ
jgi:hypothetical protein